MLFLKFVTFHFFLEMTNQYFPMWKSVRFLNSVCFKIILNQKKWIRQKFHKSSAAPDAAARPRPGPLPIPRVTPVPPLVSRVAPAPPAVARPSRKSRCLNCEGEMTPDHQCQATDNN